MEFYCITPKELSVLSGLNVLTLYFFWHSPLSAERKFRAQFADGANEVGTDVFFT